MRQGSNLLRVSKKMVNKFVLDFDKIEDLRGNSLRLQYVAVSEKTQGRIEKSQCWRTVRGGGEFLVYFVV